jgi:hypothetical protein
VSLFCYTLPSTGRLLNGTARARQIRCAANCIARLEVFSTALASLGAPTRPFGQMAARVVCWMLLQGNVRKRPCRPCLNPHFFRTQSRRVLDSAKPYIALKRFGASAICENRAVGVPDISGTDSSNTDSSASTNSKLLCRSGMTERCRARSHPQTDQLLHCSSRSSIDTGKPRRSDNAEHLFELCRSGMSSAMPGSRCRPALIVVY